MSIPFIFFSACAVHNPVVYPVIIPAIPDMRMIITGLFLLKERMIITAKMITLRLEFRESKNKQLSFAVTKAEKIFVMLYQS